MLLTYPNFRVLLHVSIFQIFKQITENTHKLGKNATLMEFLTLYALRAIDKSLFSRDEIKQQLC